MTLSQDTGTKLLHFQERLVEEVTTALPGFHRRVLPRENDGAPPSAWNGIRRRMEVFKLPDSHQVSIRLVPQGQLEVPLQTPIEKHSNGGWCTGLRPLANM